jgi:hypothetical protein
MRGFSPLSGNDLLVPYAPASNSRARKTGRRELGDATSLEEFVIDPLTIDSAVEGL